MEKERERDQREREKRERERRERERCRRERKAGEAKNERKKERTELELHVFLIVLVGLDVPAANSFDCFRRTAAANDG